MLYWSSSVYRRFLVILVCLLLVTAGAPPITCRGDPGRDQVVVALYYYTWYGSDGRHWSDSNKTLVLFGDMPVIGFYSSINETTVKWHLELISDAGVDVLFVSWWGPGSYEDNATRVVAKHLREYGLKLAILVEPYLGLDPSLYNKSFWRNILSYIKRNYIDPYSDVYYSLNGKPLVLCLNPIGATYNPSKDFTEYTIRIVGNNIDETGYQDWDLWPDYIAPLITVRDIELRIRRDGYVVLTPRYDDTVFCIHGVKTNCSLRTIDPYYTLQAYVKQWEWVLRNRDRVRIVAIYSWNEYHVRSMIEPHYDATAGIPGYDPYTIYNITRHYIRLLKMGATTTLDHRQDSQWSLVVGTVKVVTFIMLLSIATYYLYEVRHRGRLWSTIYTILASMLQEIQKLRHMLVEFKKLMEKMYKRQ